MKRVLLCGNSIFVSGLQASLGVNPGLELLRIEPLVDLIHEQVKAWGPDVLILESDLLKEKVSLSILNDFPKVRIISVDLEDNKLVLLSSKLSKQPSTEELLQLITA